MENTSLTSSCLMLAGTLYTPVDLAAIIPDSELREPGVIYDSHITIFYNKAPLSDQPKKDVILGDIEKSLGSREYDIFSEFLKKDDVFPVLDLFRPSYFDTPNGDVLILKLLDSGEVYKKLGILNSKLSSLYDVHSDYPDYQPHLTLAYLNEGEALKYLRDPMFRDFISESRVSLDDFIYSIGDPEDPTNPGTIWNLTTNRAVERHLAEEDRQRRNKIASRMT